MTQLNKSKELLENFENIVNRLYEIYIVNDRTYTDIKISRKGKNEFHIQILYNENVIDLKKLVKKKYVTLTI